MKRTFVTTDEQDAALAWKAKILGISEDEIIATFAAEALQGAVDAYLDAAGSQVYEAFRNASASEKAAVLSTLRLSGE